MCVCACNLNMTSIHLLYLISVFLHKFDLGVYYVEKVIHIKYFKCLSKILALHEYLIITMVSYYPYVFVFIQYFYMRTNIRLVILYAHAPTSF